MLWKPHAKIRRTYFRQRKLASPSGGGGSPSGETERALSVTAKRRASSPFGRAKVRPVSLNGCKMWTANGRPYGFGRYFAAKTIQSAAWRQKHCVLAGAFRNLSPFLIRLACGDPPSPPGEGFLTQERNRAGGAPRSESKSYMIAGGNHTTVYREVTISTAPAHALSAATGRPLAAGQE